MRLLTKNLTPKQRAMMPKEEAKPMPAVDLRKSKLEEAGLEWQLHIEAVKWLESEGYHPFSNRLGVKSTVTPSGITDVWFNMRGVGGIGIEFKVGRNKLSEDQERCHSRMRSDGWLVGVCRSLEEVREFVAACAIEG